MILALGLSEFKFKVVSLGVLAGQRQNSAGWRQIEVWLPKTYTGEDKKEENLGFFNEYTHDIPMI